jgi:hypothetical protein
MEFQLRKIYTALVGGAARTERSSLNHFAFEVGSLDEVFRARAWLPDCHRIPRS